MRTDVQGMGWTAMDWLANEEINRSIDWLAIGLTECLFHSVFFTGFGNLTPKTRLGQGMTTIFSLIGIPLTVLALKSAEELTGCGIRFIVTKIEICLLKKRAPKE